MMEGTILGKENIIKHARKLRRLEEMKLETTDTTIEDIRNVFELEKKWRN